MANLNFEFESFADLDEKLEQAALDILANEPAELIHITDAELDKMADDIIFQEDVIIPLQKKHRKHTTLLTLGAYALMIGWGMLCINMFSGASSIEPKPTNEQCTILPDGDCQ